MVKFQQTCGCDSLHQILSYFVHGAELKPVDSWGRRGGGDWGGGGGGDDCNY